MTAIAVNTIRTRLRLVQTTRPEYWALLLFAAAWIVLVVQAFLPAVGFKGCMYHSLSADRESSMPPISVGISTSWLAAVCGLSLHSLLMVCAMMLPTLTGNLRVLAGRNLWHRRHRAMVLALLGYAAPWVMLSIGAELVATTIPLRFNMVIFGVALVVAAAWQLTPAKRRSLIRCHLEPLIAPIGWKADCDCLWYGILLAGQCSMSCWALMFACIAGHHRIETMALTSIIIWIERIFPSWRLIGSSVLAACAVFVFFCSAYQLPFAALLPVDFSIGLTVLPDSSHCKANHHTSIAP
jgi:hypothetical protein